MSLHKEIEQKAQDISDLLRVPEKIRVFAYLNGEEVEVEDQLIIDENLIYLGTYDKWMTEGEVLEKLHFMTNKAKEMKSSENRL